MRTAGIVITVLALVAAAVGGILQRDAGDQLTAMRALSRLDLASATQGSEGWIDAKVGSPQLATTRGPISQADVAWWEVTDRRTWEEYDRCAHKDSEGICSGGWKDRSQRLGQRRSAETIPVVEGASRAEVQLGADGVKDLDVADRRSVDEPSSDNARSFTTFDGDRRDTKLVSEERALRRGEPLLVLGRVIGGEGALRIESIKGLPVATANTTFAGRLASLERSQATFGFLLYAGLAGAALGIVLLVVPLVRGRAVS